MEDLITGLIAPCEDHNVLPQIDIPHLYVLYTSIRLEGLPVLNVIGRTFGFCSAACLLTIGATPCTAKQNVVSPI